MALFNYATKEITLKIVYYGPGLSGKTTNLQYLHSVLNPQTKGKLLSLSTEADRTLFFDFLPVELGKIKDFSIRFQLYTVPGQVRYNATRKIVLKGADAVVFVADSQKEMREQNIESFENMRENLRANNIDPETIPTVLQYNKRDLKQIATVEEMGSDLNARDGYPVVEASALHGTGVQDTFSLITKLLLKDIAKRHKIQIQMPEEEAPAEERAAEAASHDVLITPPDEVVSYAKPLRMESTFYEPAPQVEAAATEIDEAVPEYEIDEELLGADTLDFETVEETAPPAAPAPETAGETQVSSIPVAEMARMNEEMAALSQSVSRLESRLESLVVELSDLKSSVSMISRDVLQLREPRDDKEIKELRREQRDLVAAVRDVLTHLRGMREKKRWFSF